jgi:transposase
MLARHNIEPRYGYCFGPRGLRWISELELPPAYTGLTSRVWQSGSREHRGPISREGSSWLRWILVEAAMKVVRRDEALNRFYTRIRKRAGWLRARVAVARKLGETCWKRLRDWHARRNAA